MNPEAVDAINIADKHLAGEPPDKRAALAKDIIVAIIDHARRISDDAINTIFHTDKHH